MAIPLVSQTYIRTEEKIGQNPNSKVYHGRCITTKQHPTCALKTQEITPVAIKVFNDRAQCIIESTFISALSEINFPHIIRSRLIQENDKPELVLDYIPTPTLFELREEITWSDIASITEQLLEVLALLNRASYIHGDLTAANLLYERNCRYITVIDWGFACKSSSSAVLDSTLPYKKIQTCNVRAPEIFLGLGHTTRADLWSLGIVIYELVTKQSIAKLEEYTEETSIENRELRMRSLQSLFSRIGLPPANVIEKIKDSPYFPWIAESDQLTSKELFDAEQQAPWKHTFKDSATHMKASSQDIERYALILDKVFRFADRASIQEVQEEFKNGGSEQLRLCITGLGNNQILKISSDDITVVFDNTLNIYRSCLHIPQNSSGKYLFTLIENEKAIVNSFPIYNIEHTNLLVKIPDLIEQSRKI